MCHRVACLVAALAVAGCAAMQPRPISVVALDRDPPSACQALGEVSGDHEAQVPTPEFARDDAFRQAERLGATHLRQVWFGRVTAYHVRYSGMAYKCPAGAMPSVNK